MPWVALERYMLGRGYVNAKGELEIAPWAEAAGVSPNTLYDWRKRDRVVQGRTLYTLASHDGFRPAEFLELLERLSRNEEMPKNLPQIVEPQPAEIALATRGVPILSVEDIHRIRYGRLQTMGQLAHAGTVPALTTDSETVGAFEVRDTSVNRVAAPPHYAVIDWSDQEPRHEAHYLITVEGQPMIRQYHGGPHERWEADSTERFEPIHGNDRTNIDVVGRVIGWYRAA